MIRKNIFGDILLEIEHPDTKIQIAPQHIEAFGFVEGKLNQFFLHYRVFNNRLIYSLDKK